MPQRPRSDAATRPGPSQQLPVAAARQDAPRAGPGAHRRRRRRPRQGPLPRREGRRRRCPGRLSEHVVPPEAPRCSGKSRLRLAVHLRLQFRRTLLFRSRPVDPPSASDPRQCTTV